MTCMASSSVPGEIQVQMVVVPPAGAGKAWGHDDAGNCVLVEGERVRMLELFHRLRDASRERRPLSVLSDTVSNVTKIDRAACPTHSLPEAPPESYVAWAPY